MKNLSTYILLVFCSAGIVASAIVMTKSEGEFMICHLIGSAILLAFVLMTFDFKNENKIVRGKLQKVFSVLVWIYNAFLVISVLAMSFAAYQHFQNHRKEMGNILVLPAMIIAVYAFFSISYYRKVKRDLRR